MDYRWLTKRDARSLHLKALEAHGGDAGVRDEGGLESALARPQNALAYSEQESSVFTLAALYGEGIARNHPFVDGNKRTALLAVRTFLFYNDYRFDPGVAESVTVMLDVAQGEASTERFSEWIEASSRPR